MTSRAPMYFILATLLIDAIGIGLVFPIMPDLMARVGAGDTGQGSVWGALLMAGYAAAQFLFAPIVGSISDALGRKPVLLIALAALTVDYVIMALAETYWLLLLGRVLAGMAGATYITATAYISDISPKEDRAANFGLVGAAFGIGFVIGPALGGLVAGLGTSAPFWFAAGISGLNLLFGIFVLTESLAPEKRRPFGLRDINPFGIILRAFRVTGLAIPLICIFVFEFANMVYPVLWSFWTREVFGWSAFWIGMTLAGYGVLITFTQAVVMPRMIARFREYRTLLIAMSSSLIGMIGFGFTGSVGALVFFMLAAALADLAPPTMTAMAANTVGDDEQGLVQGVIASLASVAAVVAPLGLAPVFAYFTAEEAPIYLPGAPFLFSAVLVVAILPLVLRLNPARRAQPQA